MANDETAILPKAEEVTFNMEAQTAAITDSLQADTGLFVLEVTEIQHFSEVPSSVPSSMPTDQVFHHRNSQQQYQLFLPRDHLHQCRVLYPQCA